MWRIWRFMVSVKRMQKYTNRIGQNTGMSKTRNRVQPNAITIDRVAECLLIKRRKGDNVERLLCAACISS